MSVELAKKHLEKFGLQGRVMEFDVSSATVGLAAEAVGCAPAMIAKTLSFDVNGTPTLIVAAGDAKIDNPKFKAQFHTKAKMLAPYEVVQRVGHEVGGVCPFGVKAGVIVYLDESLRRFETVYPACGSASSAVLLSIGELEASSGAAQWIDVCKNW